jgi:uncharacterized protein YdeI (YjbR/CyaY-like superfamily)
MGKKDPRVTAYIAKQAEFSRPILEHIRTVVHEACPEVEETLKWRMPSFMYHGMLCGMAAFKEHAAFGLWKGKLILDKDGKRADEAMGSFGRLSSLADLPPKKVLIGYVKKAMVLNEAGTRVPREPKAKKAAAKVPPDLAAALAKHKKARAHFDAFSPSHRREYVDWISGAKREETRAKRLATAIEWISEGKSQNWKYERPRAKK